MIYLIAFYRYGLRYDYSRVTAKFYLKSRWEERGYAAGADFIVGEEGNQWLAKPSLPFIMFPKCRIHKEFAADLNWYSQS
jgi:iron complex outermembrane receptor protein